MSQRKRRDAGKGEKGDRKRARTPAPPPPNNKAYLLLLRDRTGEVLEEGCEELMRKREVVCCERGKGRPSERAFRFSRPSPFFIGFAPPISLSPSSPLSLFLSSPSSSSLSLRALR